MSAALKYMIVANAGIPIMAYAFFGLANPSTKLAADIAVSCAILLLAINLSYTKLYPHYKIANFALFALNGRSLIFLSAISFIDGLYFIGTLVF